MFFLKKKDEVSDQLATYQKREAPRWGAPQYELDVGISIAGFEGEGQLGNVSISGCSMKSVTYVSMIPSEKYKVKIIPGSEDKMEPFNLQLKLSWTKSSENIFLAGFALEGNEGSSYLKKYIELLRSRGVVPDYGNMRTGHN